MKKMVTLPFLCMVSGLFAQNVGIGTSLPAAKMHIVSTGSEVLRLQAANPYISFFNGVTYKGYLWHNTNLLELGTSAAEPVVISAGYNDVAYFTPAGFVGINTNMPTERLDVAGNINLRGTLKIDGSAGTRGQVYTTGGPSFNPEWRNLAFANTTRFSASINGPGYNTALVYSATYNTNTTDIAIGTNSITVNKTGLYHLDAFFAFTAGYTGTYTQAQPPWVSVFFNSGGDAYYGSYQQDLTERIYFTGGFNKYFYYQTKFSYDVYITAGQTLTLSRLFAGQPTPANFSNVGIISGYLISE